MVHCPFSCPCYFGGALFARVQLRSLVRTRTGGAPFRPPPVPPFLPRLRKWRGAAILYAPVWCRPPPFPQSPFPMRQFRQYTKYVLRRSSLLRRCPPSACSGEGRLSCGGLGAAPLSSPPPGLRGYLAFSFRQHPRRLLLAAARLFL